MTQILRSFNQLSFPVAAVSKDLRLTEDSGSVTFGEYVVYKRKTLLSSLALSGNLEPLPTSTFYETPEALLANIKTVRNHYLLTNDLTVFSCVGQVKVYLKTSVIAKDYRDYFTVSKIPYYFKKSIQPPTAKHKPLFAVANGLVFNIGWSTHFKAKTVLL